jgi:hypothetical protein
MCAATGDRQHAMVGMRRGSGDGGGMRERGVGAKLDDDELHDDLQFAGCDLPVRLFCPGDPAGRFDNAAAAGGAGARDQSQLQYDLRHELHDDAGLLPKHLCQECFPRVTADAATAAADDRELTARPHG